MEPASELDYSGAMAELGKLLGAALREIRTSTTRTQDRWAERTGMSQSYLSTAERGESGWGALETIGTAVERAGGDPLDLLRIAVARAGGDEHGELMHLWSSADPTTREAILTLLRAQLAARTAAR